MVKRLPTTQETRVRSLGQEDPLKKEMAISSSILTWEIHRDRSPWGRKESDAIEQLHFHFICITESLCHTAVINTI